MGNFVIILTFLNNFYNFEKKNKMNEQIFEKVNFPQNVHESSKDMIRNSVAINPPPPFSLKSFWKKILKRVFFLENFIHSTDSII